jgi:hypothetical protein
MEALTEIISDFFNSIGHKQTSAKFCSMSGLPPKADIDRRAARCRVAAVCALCY